MRWRSPRSQSVSQAETNARGGGTPAEDGAEPRRGWLRRRWALVVAVLIVVALLAVAVSRLDFQTIGHALAHARPGWVALACFLMGSSLVLRAASWHEVLVAAVPGVPISWLAVLRATIVGVMVSALAPGRAGEPSRALMMARRLGGTRRMFPLVLGTVFSQTLINLGALAILAIVTFTQVSLNGNAGGFTAVVVVPLAFVLIVISLPRLLRRLCTSRIERVRRTAEWGTRQLDAARQGLRVFGRPRHGVPAVIAQLIAWALQWTACYCVLVALHMTPQGTLVTAAAILLAVNVSAILPATPSNVGVFQAACLVVLTAFGFNRNVALAYGIMLQAVEVVTAVAMGIPALLNEGLTWRDISSVRTFQEDEEHDESGDHAADRGPEPDPEAETQLPAELAERS